MPKIRLMVIMGGLSAEHDVSLSSGIGMVTNLKHEKYWIHPVYVTRDNVWYWSSKELSDYQRGCFTRNYFFGNEFLIHSQKAPSLAQLPKVDIVLNALHGRFGEDGQLQSLLDYWSIPYTGSGAIGCAVSMHKGLTKDVYRSKGIPTAPWLTLRKSQDWMPLLEQAVADFGFPLPIKDPLGGSSLGMGIVHSMDDALTLCETLFAESDEIIIEKFIAGREASCGYIQGEQPLPPTEIITESGYFDFEAKYEGKSKEVTPANMPQDWITQMQSIARQAHEALQLSDYSRTDFRITEQGELFVLETNTLPGFTPTSLIPQQAQCIGLSYSDLLDVVISKAMQRNGVIPSGKFTPKSSNHSH
jgi:D-alanine-D-alanine ligase